MEQDWFKKFVWFLKGDIRSKARKIIRLLVSGYRVYGLILSDTAAFNLISWTCRVLIIFFFLLDSSLKGCLIMDILFLFFIDALLCVSISLVLLEMSTFRYQIMSNALSSACTNFSICCNLLLVYLSLQSFDTYQKIIMFLADVYLFNSDRPRNIWILGMLQLYGRFIKCIDLTPLVNLELSLPWYMPRLDILWYDIYYSRNFRLYLSPDFLMIMSVAFPPFHASSYLENSLLFFIFLDFFEYSLVLF